MLSKIFIFILLLFIFYKLAHSKMNNKCASISPDGIFISDFLTVKPSCIKDAGKGVYTTKFIPMDTIIERAHGLVLKEKDRYGVIQNYDFELDDRHTFLAFGFASIYNHSPNPNIDYELNKNTCTIELTTTRDIKPGEELYISYESGANDWFRERGISIRNPISNY